MSHHSNVILCLVVDKNDIRDEKQDSEKGGKERERTHRKGPNP